MVRLRLVSIFVMALVFALRPAAQQKPATSPAPPQATPKALDTTVLQKPWTGDFNGMLERRHIRVLAPYSRTFLYNDRGYEGGYGVELVRTLEAYLNKKFAAQLGKRPLQVLRVLQVDVGREERRGRGEAAPPT